jgi:hypothetical protein
MKQFFFILGFLSVTGATAQQIPSDPFIQNKEHERYVSCLLQSQYNRNTSQKPTTIKQRVIARTRLFSNSNTWDSSFYKYSGSRGSDFNYDIGDYSTAFFGIYDPPGYYFLNPNPAELQTDSIFNFTRSASTGPVPVHDATWAATWRSDGQLSSVYKSTPEKFVYTYTSSGKLTEIMSYQSPDSGSAYVPAELRRISYNADYTKVTGDSTFTPFAGDWAYNRRKVCHYNNEGLIDTLSYYYLNTLSFSFFHTYYPDGKLQRLKRFVPDAYMRDILQDSFGYMPSINYATFREVLYGMPDGSDAMRGRLHKYPGLTGGRPDSASTEVWMEEYPVWRYTGSTRYTYNSKHNPVKILQTMDSLDGYPGYTNERKFYYDTYDDALALNSLRDHKELNISPNPFGNYLSILWQARAAADVHIRLLNMSGQQVYAVRLRLREGENRLTVPDLIKGAYILQVHDESGRAWSNKLLKL